MDQTSVELAQSSVKDWSFVAVTRSVTVAVTRSVTVAVTRSERPLPPPWAASAGQNRFLRRGAGHVACEGAAEVAPAPPGSSLLGASAHCVSP